MVEVTNTEVSEAEILITLLMVRRDALFTVDVSLINKPLLLLAIRDNMHSSEFREETDLHLCQKQIQNKATSRHNHPVAAVGSVLLPGINRCANEESAVQCVYWSYKGFKEIEIVFCECLCFRLVLTQEQQHQELVGVEWPVKDSMATTFSRFNLVLALLP